VHAVFLGLGPSKRCPLPSDNQAGAGQEVTLPKLAFGPLSVSYSYDSMKIREDGEEER
jgi:hypothetical protein